MTDSKIFAVIRKSDGFVRQRVTCPSIDEIPVTAEYEVRELPAGVPFGLIQYHADTDTYSSVPPCPAPMHTWLNGKWTDLATIEQKWQLIRDIRDALLSRTDWMATRAYETGSQLDPEVAAYRQALRDITAQPDPFSIAWPTRPASVSPPV